MGVPTCSGKARRWAREHPLTYSMAKKSDRLLAVEALVSVVTGNGSLSTQLPAIATRYPDANLALLREYTFGVCRWYHQLAFLSSQLLDKPLRRKDTDVHCLILLGLYQLFFMRTPDHAAVNESVALTRQLKKTWAKNLVNAVLRQALRERDELTAAVSANDQARISHPAWLMHALATDWPDQADTILNNNNQQAPMVLRVNQQRISRPDYLARLADAGMPASPGKHTRTAIILDNPVDVSALPGFADGLVSVQDEASQLAAALLEPVAGEHILDACAAPGGKTCALLEQAESLALTALDNSESRLGRVHENLTRCGLQANVLCADAAEPASWWNGTPFDVILLDAPCSGTGVIRRHPDIKVLRSPDEVQALTALQGNLLASLWRCLKPGGRMLYATCSVLRAENEAVVSRFLAQTPDASALPLSIEGGMSCAPGVQMLPGLAGTDGFYYALLGKAGG